MTRYDKRNGHGIPAPIRKVLIGIIMFTAIYLCDLFNLF